MMRRTNGRAVSWFFVLVFFLSVLSLTATASAVYFLDAGSSDMVDAMSIDANESIMIGGNVTQLYPTYVQPNNALREIAAEVPDILRVLSELYELAPLSDDNWKDYQMAMMWLLDDERKPEGYNESNPDVIRLRGFFDIYENDEKMTRL